LSSQQKKPKRSKKKEALDNLKQSISPEDNAKIDEILPDDDDEYEEEEEEYDPEERYEEEVKEDESIIDVSKLSPQERTRLENLNRTNLFLKALAIDCYQYIPKLAKKCGLSHVGIANAAIQKILTLIAETHEDKNFPDRILESYNNKVPEGYPNKVYLDAQDINELVNLVRVYEEKLHGAAKVTDPDKLFGEGNIENTKTINESSDKKEHTIMMDASSSQQQSQIPQSEISIDNGQIYPTPPGSQRDINYYISRHSIPDVGLMEMALERIPNPRPNSVKGFMTSFADLYNDWMHNPHKMIEQLRFWFGPIHGEHAFKLWRDYREQYIKQQGYTDVPPTDNFNNNNMNMNMGLQPMQMSPELLQAQSMDRMMQKTMQMMQMRIMEQALSNQTAGINSGQPFEEIYDQSGKLIKRIYGNGHAATQQNPLESTMISALTNIFQETIRGMSNEKIELYKKLNQPDSMLTDFTKTIMSNFATQSNPVNQIREMLDITKMVQNTQPQNDNNKSLDALRLEFDSKLGLRELDLKQLEMQHNWEMDRQQQKDQDSNVEKWLGTLVQVGESIFKPVALKFVEGLGGANRMPQNPLAAFAGQQQMQQPQQLSPEYQQAQAMAERQYYQPQQPQQQPSARMPPIQPIPPPMQQQQRQFNQQRAMPSEQQINQELAQLSPEQLQEIEDKMTLEDTNRERIRNLIRAHKNSRKFSRPKPPNEQQVEAQQVLFNPHQEEEFELEEDDFDEDGEERDVPIASGVDKTVSTNVEGQQKRKKSFRDFAPQTSTELKQKKKMTPQQEAMYASGQMTDQQFHSLPDLEEEDEEEEDEYSYQSVPIAGSPRNASQDALIEENLKKTRQTPSSSKKSKSKKKEEPQPKPEEEQKQQEAEVVLEETELIPTDPEDSE
jgi:hypothetical protein